MRGLAQVLFASASALALMVTCGEAISATITLKALGGYREEVAPGVCRKSISEIGAYDFVTRRLFVSNFAKESSNPDDNNSIDIFEIGNPKHDLKRLRRITISSLTGDSNLTPTSVAVRFPLVAVTAESIDPLTGPGKLLILGINGRLLRSFDVGSGPDMVTFTPDGKHVLVAVEGEPDGSHPDPEGAVAILDLSHGVFGAGQPLVADFTASNGQEDALRAKEVRISPGVSFAQDAEPEFIAVSQDSRAAYVTLQENNAIALVDIDSATVTRILPLGLKDHSRPGFGFDGSRNDNAINIANWPVFGAYQPDGVAAFEAAGATYLVTANEGDPRNGDTDVTELRNLALDPVTFPNAADLVKQEQIGRLDVSTLPQDTHPTADGKATRLVSFGGRSFSIWTASVSQLSQVFDSGDKFEKTIADPAFAADPTKYFNSQDDENQFDGRSRKRGPEPEGIAVGKVFGRTYAFIGQERHSGIMVFDVTDPSAPVFQEYRNTRDFGVDPKAIPAGNDTRTRVNCASTPGHPLGAGDLGPEGILFIPALLSPNFRPLLVVNYETSGSTRIFQIDPVGP